MNLELISFATHLRHRLAARDPFADFNALALELFALQYQSNAAYQSFCHARHITPVAIEDWTQIPAVPAAAFKELDLTCIPAAERTTVFHSSGTTEQKPSRHFHHADSLALYEASLQAWFTPHLGSAGRLLFLTPDRAAAPHSSLVHMFDTLRRESSLPASAFLGRQSADGSWALDFPAVLRVLQTAIASAEPQTLLGTAFSFVHLLDHLVEHDLQLRLPAGSRVMETGGYKNRSRTLPKAQLHNLITARLCVPATHIVCEYGMSELSSQAYAVAGAQTFSFPPWVRARLISPETGRVVSAGETGLVRVHDFANVFSVAAVQTEDLGIQQGACFELLGRAELAEPRGCSLMLHS